MPDISIDLMQFKDITAWTPKIGDMIVEEGFLSRSWNVVEGIKHDRVIVRTSGLLRLICLERYKHKEMLIQKIKMSTVGSYVIIAGGVYYI